MDDEEMKLNIILVVFMLKVIRCSCYKNNVR